MAVQHVPLPGPPALSMMACCSGSISLISFAACTDSAADKILDCSLANNMSRARLFGGTVSDVCTGAGRTISTARLSAAHGLASYCLLASFSICSSLWHTRQQRPAVRQICLCNQSACDLRMWLAYRSASQMFVISASYRSTADQYVACAAKPIRPTLMPRPPKHVGSIARSQANSETFPGVPTSSVSDLRPSVSAAVPSPPVGPA